MISLSVVIPTFNRSASLSRALESISCQTLSCEDFEVIVVDNGSMDNTSMVVASYKERIKNLFYSFNETPGLHVGRHVGLKISRSETLVYADDDIEASPTWLEGIQESFQDNTVSAVGGKCIPKFETTPPDWILEMWERRSTGGGKCFSYLSILDLGDDIKEICPQYIFGCNMSIRKRALLESGGFHPDSMPPHLIRYRGDGETHVMRYLMKMGRRAIYNPKVLVYHSVPASRMTMEYLWQRAFNQGISDSYTDLRVELRCRKNYSSRGLYRLVRQVRKGVRRMGSAANKMSRKARSEFDRIIEDGYLEGSRYHASEARKDPDLRDWIAREDYFG
jgi:glucosyl-dolichyl phosphate glucuronosyltransferase